MASDPTATLSRLLGNASIVDHEEVLKATNAVLKKNKGDQDALHTRVVALLKLDRYADALRVLDEGGDRLAERCAFEKAYALYKTGDLAQARDMYESRKGQSRGLAHVAAQAVYKLEDNEASARLYTELVRNPVLDGEYNDIRINSLAVAAQKEWAGQGSLVEKSEKKVQREDMGAFELCYNHACACLGRGDLKAGLMLLTRARTLCEAIDDLTDEEKRSEVLPMMVQQVYALTKLGQVEEAAKIQEEISISSIAEAPTKLIAQINNLAVQPESSNPYYQERLSSFFSKLSPTDQLFAYQSRPIDLDRHAISLQANKAEGVARSTSRAVGSSKSAGYLSSLSALNAAAHTDGKLDKAAMRAVQALVEKQPHDVGLALALAQMYIICPSPSLQAATEVLEKLVKRLEALNTPEGSQTRYAPGLIAALVALYRAQGQQAPIRRELTAAAKYWTGAGNATKDLYRAAGLALVDSNNAKDLEEAKTLFGRLRDDDPTDKIALSGYIAAVAPTDLSSISSELNKLTPISQLITGIDVDALESAGIASLPLTMSESRKRSTADVAKPKKKRLRKSQLPKHFVEGREMDTERWLPLKDRSSYKPKGKKGKKKAAMETQGGIVNEELTEAAAATSVVKSQGANKKKKKGKK